MSNSKASTVSLLVASVISLILGPVIILMGALAVNPSFIGGTLVIIGGIGLYAGMKALDKSS